MNKFLVVVSTIGFIAFIIFLKLNFSSSNIKDSIVLKKKLSEYNLFEGKISDLNPTKKALPIEIASPLFTDYADKKRFIVLPPGKKITIQGSGLPDYPDGTILVKTFYYNNRIKNKKQIRSILETRLLIKHKSTWNAAVYKWNEKQNEAYLLEEGKEIPLRFINETGKSYSTVYKIPSKADCISCHRQDNQIFPIGPKIRNMNIEVHPGGYKINQLDYLNSRQAFKSYVKNNIPQSPSYTDLSIPTEKRLSAYLDANCAHCHNPKGTAGITGLDLRYESTINNKAMLLKYNKIAFRMTASGGLHMPQIGTTLPHKEGIQLVFEYIKTLK